MTVLGILIAFGNLPVLTGCGYYARCGDAAANGDYVFVATDAVGAGTVRGDDWLKTATEPVPAQRLASRIAGVAIDASVCTASRHASTRSRRSFPQKSAHAGQPHRRTVDPLNT